MSNVTEPRFTLKELVEASGVTERNIRYYIQQGLIPSARGRGRSAFYTPEHLEKLARVVDLRSRGLSIDEIRESLTPKPAVAPRDAEMWEHVHLHPDIELVIRASAPEEIRGLAVALEQFVTSWLATHYTQDDLTDDWLDPEQPR